MDDDGFVDDPGKDPNPAPVGGAGGGKGKRKDRYSGSGLQGVFLVKADQGAGSRAQGERCVCTRACTSDISRCCSFPLPSASYIYMHGDCHPSVVPPVAAAGMDGGGNIPSLLD